MVARTSRMRRPGALAAVAAVAAALALPSPAGAAGFAINEQGAAAMGMGCAVTAIADRPSAIFYNAAGLAMQRGLGIEIGDTLILPMGTHTDPASGRATDAEQNVFYPPSAYASYRMFGQFALGLGFFVPYGLGMEWPEGWAGFQEIESIELQTFNTTIAAAWRPWHWLSIGGGVDIATATVELRKGLEFVDERGSLHGAGTAMGVGGNLGLLVKLLRGRLRFGFNYRSAVQLDFEGDADFTVPDAFAGLLEDQPLRSSLKLPHVMTIGIAGRPLDMMTLSLDLAVTMWSSFAEFGMTFPEDEDRPEDERISQVEPRNWTDEFALRFGVEVLPPEQDFALRVGLIYDRSPSPPETLSPSLPDADRIDVSVGAGYEFDFGLAIDVAYMYVHMLERSSGGEAFPGRYEGSAHLVGLSFEYRYVP